MMKFLHTKTEKVSELSSPKRQWRISFHRSPSSSLLLSPPNEFLCPISGSLMADPVIISSGQTFERACVEICKTFQFRPILADKSIPDFSTVIPNLALKSTILKWCHNSSIDPPKALDSISAEKLVRTFMASRNQTPIKSNTELTRHRTRFSSSSDETLIAAVSTPPCCYSSSSSTENETLNPNPNSAEEEEFITKLRSSHVFEIEEAVISLRQITRSRNDIRINLCTPRLLSAVQSLIISKYINIQVNAVAALVNLSLDKVNKIKILRAGLVPPLIDVLKRGFPESQEHASGALFSLALDDENKTAIGVLGALPPLLHMLRSKNESTRHDSALALYHLSLVQSNRTKLVKLGAIGGFLGMVKTGRLAGRVMMILGNLVSCSDGRTAVMDAGGVECLVGLLRGNEFDLVATRASCVAVLYGLSLGGLRFKGLAKAVNAGEVLTAVKKMGGERERAMAGKMLEMMKERDEEEEEVDWEELLDPESTRL